MAQDKKLSITMYVLYVNIPDFIPFAIPDPLANQMRLDNQKCTAGTLHTILPY